MPWSRIVVPVVACAVVLTLAGGCAQTSEPSEKQEPSSRRESPVKPQACTRYPGLVALARDKSFLRAWWVRGNVPYADVMGSCYGSPRKGGYRGVDCKKLLKFHGLIGPVTESGRRELRAEILANYCDYLRDRVFSKAEEHCEEAIESSPINPLARYARGRLYMKKGLWKAAIADFSVSIDRSPCFLPALFHRANAYMQRGLFSEAQADLDAIDAEQSNLRPIPIFRELLRYQQGDRKGALSRLERMTAIDPGYEEAYVLRAQLLADEGRFQAALAALERVIRFDDLPSSAKWRAIRGRVHLAMGAPAKAVADFEQAVAIDNDEDAYNFGLATALACSGRLAEATEAFSLAKNRANISNPKYYYSAWIARAWLLATASEDALRDGNAALKELTGFWAPIWKGAAPSNRLYSDVIEVEAASRAEVGEFEKAIELQKKAIDTALRNRKREGTISEMRTRLGLYESGQPYRTDAFCPELPPEDPYRWLLEAPWHTERKINPFESAATGPILSGGSIAQGGLPCAPRIYSSSDLPHSS